MATTQNETIAKLHRANVELRQSLDAAQARESALAEVLEVINRSPVDPVPVFEAILDKAHQLCGAAAGSLMTYDGTYVRARATRGFPDEHEALLRQPFRLQPFGGLSARQSIHAEQPKTFEAGLERLIHGERLFQIADFKTFETQPDSEVNRSTVERTNVRSCVTVPLRRDGAFLGYISAFRLDVRPFSEAEIALLETFAAQAVIAMENARLISEQREALEQQIATAEVLQVINASPGNLAPVFEAILEKAHTFCGAPLGSLVLYDGEQLRAVATRGYPSGYETLARQGFSPIPPFKLLVSGEHFVHVPDTATWPGVPNEEDDLMRRAAIEIARIRTALFVPLRKNTTVLGYISAQRQEKRPFTDKQIALLENFAAQAVIAMENARLITEQREALEQQTATAEVLRVINASPGDLAPVFDTILEKAHRLCGAVIGSLLVYDGEYFQAAATHGHPQQMALFVRQPFRPNHFLHELLRGERIVHTPDFRTAEADQDHELTRNTEKTGVRTSLWVPLRKDGTLLGCISAFRMEVHPFSEREITLLESFAAQAVIAMENARLITEQREALEQQTATAEVLQVINSSPGDLAPVFDAILDKAHTLCGAVIGSLVIFDGTYFRAVATHGWPNSIAALFREPTGPNHARQSLVDGERFVQVLDIRAIGRRGPNSAWGDALVEGTDARTMLLVPLRKSGSLLGFISAFRLEVRPFSEKEIALLENFAVQAVIAMDNARLITEQREALEQQTATTEVLQVINASPGNLTPVFNAMLEKAMRLCEAAHGHIWIYDGERAHSVAVRGLSNLVEWMRQVGSLRPGASPLGRIVRGESIVHIADALEDKAYSINSAFRDQVNAGRLRTILAIALRKENTLLGVIVVHRQEVRPFSDKQITLLQNFAAQAVIAMENARLIDEIRAARDNAEATLRQLKAAQANLIQAEKMASLGQLTAGIAHEIKNPLNFVNNFAALSVDLLSELKETAAPGFAALTDGQRAEIDDVSAMLTSNLEKITEHGKRADGIVKAMLEHSRGSSSERRMVELNALIDETLNLAYHGARAQDQGFNITLERDFGESIPPIEVNPQDMTRVFLNVFSNGFYAATRRARDGGDAEFVPTLKVTTRDAGNAVEIRVRDNGTGIPTEIRDKLFQPFFTTKPSGEGTGLGLSITYDIVTKQHGGTITVDSEVDAFTEFVVTLPRQMFADGGSRA